MSNRDDRPEKMEDGSTAAPAEKPVPRSATIPTDQTADDPVAGPADNSPAPGDLPQGSSPTVDEFDQHIQNCNDDLEAIDAQLGELRRQHDQVERDRDQLIQEKARHFPPPNQAQAMRAYLDQQHQNRVDRAERLGKLIEAGIVSGKAPIDAVRARSTGHGRRVVQHPLVQPSQG